jgi:hypothetical protein
MGLKRPTPLKVLSSERDLAENGINQKVFINGLGTEVFRKIDKNSTRSPCERPLKLQRLVVQLLAISTLS